MVGRLRFNVANGTSARTEPSEPLAAMPRRRADTSSVASCNAIYLEGRWRPVRAHSVFDLLWQGVLGTTDVFRLAIRFSAHRHAFARLDLSDFSS
jgi:hypothetical protein